nr:DUF2231 domain-containing protein [Sporolactobacillus kofuensis]
MGTILQVVALWRKDFFDKAALFLLSVGFISGIAAYLSGDGAEEFAAAHWGSAYRTAVEIHQFYATVTLLLFGTAIGLRILFHFFQKKILIPLMLIFCIFGSITLALTGHYGGQMVYIQKHVDSLYSPNTKSSMQNE